MSAGLIYVLEDEVSVRTAARAAEELGVAGIFAKPFYVPTRDVPTRLRYVGSVLARDPRSGPRPTRS